MADDQQKQVLDIQKELLSLSKKRNTFAAIRTYMNAERTLSVWVRTSLSIMIFGIAIDRFDLFTRGLSVHPGSFFGHSAAPASLMGLLLVVFSVVMAFCAGWRFLAFSKKYKKSFPLPAHHRIWLPPTYAFMMVIFGVFLAIFMWILP